MDSLTDLAATARRNRCDRIGIDSTGVPLPERVVGHRCFFRSAPKLNLGPPIARRRTMTATSEGPGGLSAR